jgi:type I restriction enzyme S subunit
MEVKPGYKQTQIGVIPQDWDETRLGADITLLSGHHILASDCNTQGVGVPYITGPADFPDGLISHTKFTERPSTICEPGDILVTVKGSGAGSLVLADASYCISRQLMAIRVSDWDKNFVFYSLPVTFRDQYARTRARGR